VIFIVKRLMAVAIYIGSIMSFLYSPEHCHGSFFSVGSEELSFLLIHEDLLSLMRHSQVICCWRSMYIFVLYLFENLSLAQAHSILNACYIFVLHSDNHVISIHIKYGRSR
jgi:hypothetical protein